VDYVGVDEKVEPGEMFYTSGDDRIFPRGFPAGVVRSVRNGTNFKEISIDPSGVKHGVEDLLIILQGVHQNIPEAPPANQPVYLTPQVPPTAQVPVEPGQQPAVAPTPAVGTEADKVRSFYKAVGEAQNHTYGVGPPGTKAPDFNMKLPVAAPASPARPAGTAVPPGATSDRTSAPGNPPQTPPSGKAPDAARRANQAAGAPAGGRL
jgi:rod shape-determining protein MreC